MVRFFGWLYGPFHHVPHNFPCSLYRLCALYYDVLGLTTQNMLAYHMNWWNSLGSYNLVSACIALVMRLCSRICYNLNWIEKSLPLGIQKMTRRPPSLPMLLSWLGLILSVSYIPFLLGDCELSLFFLKYWAMSWGLGSASEMCCVIHTWLEKN